MKPYNPRYIHNPDNIPIDMCTIPHEFFKLGIGDSMSSYDVIEIFPKNHMSILVFKLKVTVDNGYNLLINQAINVVGHGHLTVDAFDMIGHDLCIFEIAT